MSWSLDTTLAGRELRFAELGPRAGISAPEPNSVVALMAGAATLDGRPLDGSGIAAAPGREIVAGPEGCMVGAVCWEGEPPQTPIAIESTDSRRFEKYESFQAQLRLRDGARDFLAPWELYHVRMVAEARARVQLHVHEIVTNVLLVRGPVGAARGYLVVERDGRVEATPLVSGDRAIVRPGPLHHVVPVQARDPIEMIVFNSEVSSYEDVESSDFHLRNVVPWSEVSVLLREDPRPRLTVIS